MNMLRSRLGSYSFFGKGFVAPPPPGEKETVKEIHHYYYGPDGQQLDAQAMAELQRLRAQSSQLQQQVSQGNTDPAVMAELEKLRAQVEDLKHGSSTPEGKTVVEGSGGKTVKQMLTSPGQTKFTRTTNKVGRNLYKDDYRRLGPPPPGYDEAKYLAKHADVASAVKQGAMPSGLWHYLMYGKKEGRALAGYRRPGNLAGIFANWDWR